MLGGNVGQPLRERRQGLARFRVLGFEGFRVFGVLAFQGFRVLGF